MRRYKAKSRHYFSRKLVEMLGPEGRAICWKTLCHYASAIQKLYEDLALQMAEYYLGDVLAETGRLALAGTGAMNIRLNHRFHSRK